MLSRALNRLERRHAEIRLQNLELPVVPMTIRRQGKTALTADQDRHTCFENLAESVGTLDDFSRKIS